MSAQEYQIWYWYIKKGMRYDFSEKKMAIAAFERDYGRPPRPAEIAIKRIPVTENA